MILPNPLSSMLGITAWAIRNGPLMFVSTICDQASKSVCQNLVGSTLKRSDTSRMPLPALLTSINMTKSLNTFSDKVSGILLSSNVRHTGDQIFCSGNGGNVFNRLIENTGCRRTSDTYLGSFTCRGQCHFAAKPPHATGDQYHPVKKFARPIHGIYPPPLTHRVWPVMKALSGPSRNMTGPTMSSGTASPPAV